MSVLPHERVKERKCMKIRFWLAMVIAVALIGISLIGRPAQASPPRQGGGQPITVSNAANVKQIAELDGQKQAIFALAFSPDGKTLAAGSIDSTIILWDIASHKQIALLQGHTAQIGAIGFTADGATLYSSSYDRSVRAWDAKTGKAISVYGPDPNNVDAGILADNLAEIFNKDASLLAYSTDGGTLYVFDTKSNKQISMDPGVT